MNQSYVFYNGEIVEEEKVSISIRSKVVNYGLGVSKEFVPTGTKKKNNFTPSNL